LGFGLPLDWAWDGWDGLGRWWDARKGENHSCLPALGRWDGCTPSCTPPRHPPTPQRAAPSCANLHQSAVKTAIGTSPSIANRSQASQTIPNHSEPFRTIPNLRIFFPSLSPLVVLSEPQFDHPPSPNFANFGKLFQCCSAETRFDPKKCFRSTWNLIQTVAGSRWHRLEHAFMCGPLCADVNRLGLK
jgi:hypothetical protein